MNLNIYILNGGLVIIFDNTQKWYHSIRWKVFLSFFFISLITLLFFSYTVKNSLQDYFKGISEKDTLYQANKIAGQIKKEHYLDDILKKQDFDNYIEEKSKDLSFRILVIDSQGVVVNDSNKTEIGKTFIVPEVLAALDGKDYTNFRKGEETIYSSAYITGKEDKIIGAVLIISSFSEIANIIDGISNRWFITTIFASIIIGIATLFISQIMLAPIKKILATIQSIKQGQIYERIDIKGNNEFSRLSQAFNSMTNELEQIEISRQEFVSNVSHELKTPLSSIKVLSDSILLQENAPIEMYREFLQDINSEIDRMTLIVNELLALVKLDHREAAAYLNIEEVDVNKMLEDILKRIYPLAEQKNIELIYDNNKKVVIEADEMKLSLAISNLVENGIKYTPKNGSVKVIIDGDHQNAFITVQDTGIGINEEEQTKIFNRFYRVDKTRDRETGGTGLGLAITHSTIILHNGSIKVSSKEGQGASFFVRLPLKYVQKI